eukprot:TRINITY_DN88303_c0_g1_i1.p1 TRINITY_DN88303_c0_g1~~TRINITY_DN88303_c0_g1_i1.p1  ORF type:complete len:460 (+),score=53.44 TRINITY_DN88303_c0_g1_i1:41-1420(+)
MGAMENCRTSLDKESVFPRSFHWWLALFLGICLRVSGFARCALVLAAIAAVACFAWASGEKPRLVCGSEVSSIVLRCQSLFRVLHLTPWAWNAHVQATMFCFWPQMNRQIGARSVRLKRELVTCADLGQVALDWIVVGEDDSEHLETDLERSDPIILTLPGIVGKSNNTYFLRFGQFLHSKSQGRWRCAVKSWRGIHCELSEAQPRPETWGQHAADDTLAVAEMLKKRYPKAPLLLLGWSHGGNVALAALASERGAELFSAGVMVSSPYDLAGAMAFLEKDQWFPYAYVNTKALVDEYRASGAADALVSKVQWASAAMSKVSDALRWQNLATHLAVRRPYGSTWHDLFTRRYTGHDSVLSYYASVEKIVQQALPKIRVPVLCLLSEDDSVTPPSTFSKFIQSQHAKGEDVTLCTSSPWLAFSVTKRGGHCGWFYGLRGFSWVDEVATEFLEACMQSKLD